MIEEKLIDSQLHSEVVVMRDKLSVSDVMRLLNVSRNTVNSWIREGTIKGEQSGDYSTAPWEFTPEEVERARKARIKEFENEIARISTPVDDYMKQMRYV